MRMKRTGNAALEVEVEREIARLGGEIGDAPRWHEVVLYRVATAERVAVQVHWHSRWQGELDHDDAVVLREREVVAWLRARDPLAHYIGPPASSGGGRREREMAAIRERWAHLVTDAAAALGGAEERYIEPISKGAARSRLREQLLAATPEQAQAARDVLRLGAGHLGLPDGASFVEPAWLPAERREVYIACVEAVHLDEGDDWTLIHAGDWESVLATLVIEGDWAKIEETAAELRARE